ncbi:Alpha/Beta hydrolase protein [Bombardia bombarda]|uniref:Alpha/Beta hydrolase protein n=1 Tax=Bombardia bombarda TaxID=252184 RepID=A0AA39XLV3_9PEZI|nr:Alpha/Beta hydrolase protein [Bombardia bombarda]
MGRSKSRPRDLGPRSRISIVPEMPELTAALSLLEENKGVEEEGQKSGVTRRQDYEEFGRVGSPIQEILNDVNVVESHGTAFDKTHHDNQAHSFGSESELRLGKPRTPTGLTPVPMPTPRVIPGQRREEMTKGITSSPPDTPPFVVEEFDDDTCAFDEDMTFHDDEARHWASTPFSRPSTPHRSIPTGSLPLTPEATPDQTSKPTRSKSETKTLQRDQEAHFPSEDSAARNLKDSTIVDKDRRLQTPRATDPIHSPSGLLSHVTVERSDQNRRVGPEFEGVEQRAHYHEVWRITDYAPEFPLPSRPYNQPLLASSTSAQPRFDGSPLKEPPRSQLSREASIYKLQDQSQTNSYSAQTPSESSNGDWVVNILSSPSEAYVPGDHRSPSSRTRSRSRTGGRYNRGRYPSHGRPGRQEWDAPPVIERAFHAASVGMIQGLTVPMGLYRGLRDIYYPPPERPDIIKAYPIRRRLPVRIFFPSHYDLTSPTLLPTLFTLHGGGFTVGHASDDDNWNRTFSDAFTVLVISLNYSKAPWAAAFPAPLLDAEALYHAVLNDESLPIDRMRTVLSGFDAGANLALALAQLPSVRTGYDPHSYSQNNNNYHNTCDNTTSNTPRYTHPYTASSRSSRGSSSSSSTQPPPPPPPLRSHPPPAAVISICGILDFSTPPSTKARTRPYKRQLRGPRGWGPGLDWMARLLPSSAWSYIPYGHDTADPLLSPAYAARADLPPHVFVIAAELDCLAHESWRAACSWAGNRVVPDGGAVVGRRAVGRWLLVPDVVHGFDSAGWRNKYLWGDEEARMDAEMKTLAYQREVAEWLWGTVWA